MSPQIQRAQATDLDAVAPLFDAYRCFYGMAPDLPRATAFIGERLRRQDSVILLARGVDGAAVGFTQL